MRSRPPAPKKASSKSSTTSETSTYVVVVEADDGPFGADRAEAHQLHGCLLVAGEVSGPGVGGQAGAARPARKRLPDSGYSLLLLRRELAARGGDEQRSRSGPTKATLVVCGARQVDDVEQVAGGGVAADLPCAPGGEPEVAVRVDADAVGHCVGELEVPGAAVRRLRCLVVVAHPDPTAGTLSTL